MSIDPVCGKVMFDNQFPELGRHVASGALEIDPMQGTRCLYREKWYYFCNVQCRSQFMAKPEDYEENIAPKI